MLWTVFTFCSMAVLVLTLILSVIRGSQRMGHKINALHILLIGVFLANFLLLFPPYYNTVLAGNGLVNSLFMVFHDTLVLFTLGSDFNSVLETYAAAIPAWLQTTYTVYGLFLYAFTPLLSAGFLLSFFRNASAYWKYIFNYTKDVYVFSEMNEKTVALALDIIKRDRGASIIIAGQKKKDDEEDLSGALGAITFSKNVYEINLTMHSKHSRICFFYIKDDASVNMEDAFFSLERYKERTNTEFFIFSPAEEHDSILNSVDTGKVIVRRVNSMQSFVHMFLYKEGKELFDTAEYMSDGRRRISIALVGFGAYGREFARVLPWYCSQQGFVTEIHIIEKFDEPMATFRGSYPSLNYTDSDSFDPNCPYSITFHPVNVETEQFAKDAETISSFTYALVLTGDDDRNLRIAIRLRTLFRRLGTCPIIRTRVYNSTMSYISSELKNHNGQNYDIRMLGSLQETYSYESVIDSEWSTHAKEELKTYNTPERWKFEYYHTTAITHAIYKKTALMLCIDTEGEEFKKYYHDSWCAYMYARGYTFATIKDDMALGNPNLVRYEDLPAPYDNEKRKAIK